MAALDLMEEEWRLEYDPQGLPPSSLFSLNNSFGARRKEAQAELSPPEHACAQKDIGRAPFDRDRVQTGVRAASKPGPQESNRSRSSKAEKRQRKECGGHSHVSL
jgi:hypothetical protein